MWPDEEGTALPGMLRGSLQRLGIPEARVLIHQLPGWLTREWIWNVRDSKGCT